METAFLIVGSVAIWAYLASRSTIPFLKTFMMLETMLMTIAMGWLANYSIEQGDITATQIWFYIMSISFLGWIGVYGGLWITGALEKEEIDNGF